MKVSSIIKNEILLIKAIVAISAVILAGVLIGLGRYGIDLASVFLGTPWDSPLPHTRGTTAIAGGIAFITLAFGGLLVAGLLALLRRKRTKLTG